MTDLRKAAEMALEALESVYGKGKRCEAAINALRQALAQPEQEPVAWIDNNKITWLQKYGDEADVLAGVSKHQECEFDVPLYIAPPKREWVGLTDEEIDIVFDKHFDKYAESLGQARNEAWPLYERELEAKLKEKNCG